MLGCCCHLSVLCLAGIPGLGHGGESGGKLLGHEHLIPGAFWILVMKYNTINQVHLLVCGWVLV